MRRCGLGGAIGELAEYKLDGWNLLNWGMKMLFSDFQLDASIVLNLDHIVTIV